MKPTSGQIKSSFIGLTDIIMCFQLKIRTLFKSYRWKIKDNLK